MITNEMSINNITPAIILMVYYNINLHFLNKREEWDDPGDMYSGWNYPIDIVILLRYSTNTLVNYLNTTNLFILRKSLQSNI